MRSLVFRFVTIFILVFAGSSHAFAWDYEGHRAVNLLALHSLPPEFPAFVHDAPAQERIAFLGGEPDRWRNAIDLPIRHENAPDHYLDMESLALADLTPENLTDLRYVFAAQLALARANHPERFHPIDPEKNQDHTRELIGFLPWTIAEYYGKLKSAFSYLKAFEELGSPDEIANARANVIYIMGVMGHFVGDGAQPLHTTIHNNGWVGDNPNGYTTARTFHAWIDGGFIVKTGKLDVAALQSRVQPAHHLAAPAGAPTGRDPIFSAVMSYLSEQHTKVQPLYELEKAGKLKGEGESDGRQFIEEQIVIAGQMLGSLWLTAWQEAPPDKYLRAALLQRQPSTAAPARP